MGIKGCKNEKRRIRSEEDVDRINEIFVDIDDNYDIDMSASVNYREYGPKRLVIDVRTFRAKLGRK